MFAKAGQTAEPNWLKCFEGTFEYPGGNIDKKKLILFSKFEISKWIIKGWTIIGYGARALNNELLREEPE